MRTFIKIWVGQTTSTVGSRMTAFAITLWLFEQTGRVTSLVALGVAGTIPRIFVMLLAGVMVDRFKRKWLMFAGDLVAAIVTLISLGLLASEQFPIWFLYVRAAVIAPFDTLQTLAYDASISMLVDKKQYMRASSMGTLTTYTSNLIAPALTGVLYYPLGLWGIMIIDLATFLIGMATLLPHAIPQPARPPSVEKNGRDVRHDLTAGIRTIWQSRGLRQLLWIQLVFLFFADFASALHAPMILARTNNNARTLAAWSAASGVGGVVASLVMSGWGGSARRVLLYCVFTTSAGIGKLMVSVGQTLGVWVPGQCYTSANFPFRNSAYSAIWRTQTDPAIQGRVFGTNAVLAAVAAQLGMILSATLADFWAEPSLRGGQLAWLVGAGAGSGMAFLAMVGSVGMIGVGAVGWWLSAVRELDRPAAKLAPDKDLPKIC